MFIYSFVFVLQMAGQIDMNRQSDLMAAFEEQCSKWEEATRVAMLVAITLVRCWTTSSCVLVCVPLTAAVVAVV